MGLVLSLWPTVESWIINNTKARIVYIDEKWLKIRGKWHYWFVVLDKETGLPVLSSLLTSLGNSATKFIALKLKALGKIPKVIITDGLAAYKKMFKKGSVTHQRCIFHHQQGVTRFLTEHFEAEDELNRKKEMKKVFQTFRLSSLRIETNDKRTVKRRLENLEKEAQGLGITDWVSQDFR